MITKELFVSVIEAMRLHKFHYDQNAKLLQEAFAVDSTHFEGLNGQLYNSICDLLNFWFPKDENCPIRHYCFMLNFGKFEEDYVSPEELYEDLIKEYYPLLSE